MNIWLHAFKLDGEDGKISTPKCSLNVCMYTDLNWTICFPLRQNASEIINKYT